MTSETSSVPVWLWHVEACVFSALGAKAATQWRTRFRALLSGVEDYESLQRSILLYLVESIKAVGEQHTGSARVIDLMYTFLQKPKPSQENINRLFRVREKFQSGQFLWVYLQACSLLDCLDKYPMGLVDMLSRTLCNASDSNFSVQFSEWLLKEMTLVGKPGK